MRMELFLGLLLLLLIIVFVFVDKTEKAGILPIAIALVLLTAYLVVFG